MLNNTNQFLRHLEHAYYQQFGGIPQWLNSKQVSQDGEYFSAADYLAFETALNKTLADMKSAENQKQNKVC